LNSHCITKYLVLSQAPSARLGDAPAKNTYKLKGEDDRNRMTEVYSEPIWFRLIRVTTDWIVGGLTKL
jgi:hypothetical protein